MISDRYRKEGARRRGLRKIILDFPPTRSTVFFFFFAAPERERGEETEMEFSLSGNALKTFARSITCLARVGNELAIQASPSQLILHTINSSRSAYQSITFKSGFFDMYTISGTQVQCSLLLKAICSVLRTPISSINHLSVQLPGPDSSKVQWTLECYSGMKKSYWITCNVESDIQHLSLDRRRFPSSLVVRPRDLNRLLANFQSSLQEITVIATEPASMPTDAASEIGGKAVELRSYIDPTKDNDSALHTQLWIDPVEEFVQYTHTGDPVDVTFGVKELKAFLAFCEGCEVDIHLYFEKAGDSMKEIPQNLHKWLPQPMFRLCVALGRSHWQGVEQMCLSILLITPEFGSAARSGSGADGRQAQGERNLNATEQREIQRISMIQISKDACAQVNEPAGPRCHPTEEHHEEEARDRPEINGHDFSQRHLSNWVDANEDDDDDADENELCVQPTPPYYEEQ
ncbi:uncharacterized protein LOC110659765 isoform X2 [Hevea brasiliensis]|uniref:uncharacterized protein LOC110659765 isoform X2 n=1 Tax=Hevea brasiliensis TaxID=3981 RepID=UPI0025E3FEE2|nr:uncharacterized protein LOC110659765 isoform X2 [Hevea brasiliensis]